MTSAYKTVLGSPGALRFFVPAGLARLGTAMTSLGIIWLVHWGTHSYGTAGIVAGGFALTEGCIGPLVARLIDRRGQRAVLTRTLVVHGAAILLLVGAVANHAPLWLLIAASGLAGGSIPQIGALSSARWSWLLKEGDPLRTAFALEAVSNDVAFLVGPALVVVISANLAGFAGTLLAASVLLLGGFLFVSARQSAPPPGARPTVEEAARTSRGLREPILWVLVAANLGLGLFFGAAQLSVTAFAVERGDGAYAGLLYGFMSLASVAAGFGYGARTWRATPATQLVIALAVLSFGCLCLVFVPNTIVLAVVLLIPGLAIAPSLIVFGVLTQSSVDRAVLTQAFVWQNSASAAGVVLGASLAGHAIDVAGADAGFVVAAACVSAITVIICLWRLTMPRHHPKRVDATPSDGAAHV